jgi:hypothetical protein
MPAMLEISAQSMNLTPKKSNILIPLEGYESSVSSCNFFDVTRSYSSVECLPSRYLTYR